MYCKPIFIAGKEVPQRELAITVNSIAFLWSSATRFDFRKNYPFLFEKGKRVFLRLFLKKSDRIFFGNIKKPSCFRLLDENGKTSITVSSFLGFRKFPIQFSHGYRSQTILAPSLHIFLFV